VNREGCRIPIDYKPVPIEDDWGKIIGTVSIFRESADHKAAAQKLLAAEEQIRSLLELSSEAVVTCDRRGSIIKGNHAAASMVGLDPEVLPGKDLFSLGIFSWAEAQKILLLFGKALETDSPVSEEVALLGKDSSPTIRAIKAVPLKSGHEPALIVTIKSISKQ
jgi:PAS domain S-box-containing protein